MIKFFTDKLQLLKLLGQEAYTTQAHPVAPLPDLCGGLQENLNIIKEAFSPSDDVIVREFCFGENGEFTAALVFMDGLVNETNINDNIIRSLMRGELSRRAKNMDREKGMDVFKLRLLTAGDVEKTERMGDVFDGILSGNALLFVDGYAEALNISVKGWQQRSISEPQTESVIRGPREGFTENLRTNTAMLRRKIKDPDLVFETMKVGRKTQTNVCVSYIRNLANQELIDEVKKRIGDIEIDAVLESGYIEEYLDDNPFSFFSSIGFSEKPDVVAARMLEGRVGIIIDGTPFVLTAPMLFIEAFQTSEDYYARSFYASFLRWLRVICFAISLAAPAIYVAITTFHQEVIPTALLFTMAAAREGIPFPAVMEAFIMLIAFEILREAGVRLPRPVGQAVSIVGALVMGEAAVSAGLVSTPMVIVAAITAVAGFAVPMLTDAMTVLRFALLILAGTMGGFGLTMGVLLLLVHISSLTSFGTPCMAPLAPVRREDLKDALVRMPLWTMITRPKGMARQDNVRQEFQVPESTEEEEKYKDTNHADNVKESQ